MKHQADDVDWQQTSQEYSVGDVVTLLEGRTQDVGRVVAVWPAIGMLDLQFPSGWTRKPVEEVIKTNGNNPFTPPLPEHAEVPGGAGTVPVSGGPPDRAASVQRVAEAYAKRAMYWADRDRQYRATKAELESGSFSCPRCKGQMGKANYKRRNGCSERLLACHNCLFLIKPMDAGLGDGC